MTLLLPEATTLPTLETPRLRLRPLREDDADALLAIFGDATVTRYWAEAPWTGLDEARALLASVALHWAARTGFRWGIVRTGGAAGDQVVGTFSLFAIEARHRRAEVGFALAREAWGAGLAREAAAAVAGFAFDTLGLHRLEADVDPRNAASLRTLEALGFRREGHLRERYHAAGEAQDSVLLGLLRTDPRPRVD